MLSWKIFSAFGIPVKLHASMLIIPIWVFSQLGSESIVIYGAAAMLTFLLFSSVLLHELGHALTGRRYGAHTADIILTPIGGMARMQSMPQKPKHEIFVAAAGPLVSFAISGIAFGIQFLLPLPYLTDILYTVATLNLMLGGFNLVPALPMDGGRILRGSLALKFPHLTATKISTQLGKSLAIVGFLYGLFWDGGWSITLISVFVYFAASQEMRIAQMRAQQEQTGPIPGFGRNRGYYVYRESRGSNPSGPPNWSGPAGPQNNANVKVVTNAKVKVVTPDEKN